MICQEETVDSWCFVHVADIQVGSPKSFRFAPAWKENWELAKKQIMEIAPEQILVGGDLTRDGYIHLDELEYMKKELSQFPVPVHVIAGNMDTGNKHTYIPGRHRTTRKNQCDDMDLNITTEHLNRFSSLFGDLWWSYEHKNVRFTGVPDMIINSGLPEEEAFWKWSETLKTLPRKDHHVWVLHYPLFSEKPDEPEWDVANVDQYYDWYFSINNPGRDRLMELFKATGTDLVISGHVHCRKKFQVDGITFQISPATCSRQWEDRWEDGDASLGFLKYTVSDQGLKEEFIPLDVESKTEGYGPKGHPAPHVRDYSKAWEKE